MAKQYMHNHISIVPKVMIPGIEWAVQLPTPLDAEAFRTVAQVLAFLEERPDENMQIRFHNVPELTMDICRKGESYPVDVRLWKEDEVTGSSKLLLEDYDELHSRLQATLCGEDAVGAAEQCVPEKGLCWTVSVPVSLQSERFMPVAAAIHALGETRFEYLIMELQRPVGEVTYVQTTVENGRYTVELHLEGKYRMKQYSKTFDTAEEAADIFRQLACEQKLPDLKSWKDIGWKVLKMAGWRPLAARRKVS